MVKNRKGRWERGKESSLRVAHCLPPYIAPLAQQSGSRGARQTPHKSLPKSRADYLSSCSSFDQSQIPECSSGKTDDKSQRLPRILEVGVVEV
jgi:hypothetical protein